MKKEQDLFERLQVHSDGDMYPFHMPGHKRNAASGLPEQLVKSDITEIENFDNLHHAQGILRDAMNRAANLYGSEKTYFLVNGSTCGVLAAISSVLSRGDTLILARNAHMSAYYGAYLRGCRIVSLYPAYIREYGICGAVSIGETERMLKMYPEAKAVMITSPTYEGVVSDVAALAELVHAYGRLLIVDEAHGAHFGYDKRLPDGSVQCGADLVIHSLHKTLPSLTQTALLHKNGSRVDEKRLERFLRIYQTSSPSYLLMGSIDRCIRMLSQNRGQWFDSFFEKRTRFMQKISDLKMLTVVSQSNGRTAFDPGKLLIVCNRADINGRQLQQMLYKQYHLQMEMAGESAVLAILTVMDTDEGWERLADALLRIDAALVQTAAGCINVSGNIRHDTDTFAPIYGSQTARMTIAQAMDEYESQPVELEKSAGHITAEFVYAYPPGNPFIVPGEEMTEQMIEKIRSCRSRGLDIQGPEDGSVKMIRCVMRQD